MSDPDFTPEEAAWLRKWARRQVRDTDENEAKMAASRRRLAERSLERLLRQSDDAAEARFGTRPNGTEPDRDDD